jgi:hypothetical protein
VVDEGVGIRNSEENMGKERDPAAFMTRSRGTSNGARASVALAGICAGAILAMFSQANMLGPESVSAGPALPGAAALDPGERGNQQWGRTVPSALEKAAEVDLGPAAAPGTPAPPAPTRLRLR